MSSKLALCLLGAALALTATTVTNADDHGRDRDRCGTAGPGRRDEPSHQRDRGPERRHDDRREWGRHDDRGPRGGDHWRGDDHRGRDVWSHHQPRPRHFAGRRPPPLRHEFRSPRPSHRHCWIPGCWRWRAGYTDWVWVGGYWDLPPYENYVYVEPSYVTEGDRVVYVDGGWCEPGYANDGAATGAVLGGIAGGVIGHQSHNTGVGVLLGAVAGSIIGHEADKERAERRAAATPPPVTRVVPARSAAPDSGAVGNESADEAGQPQVDQDIAAARERARVAKERLAATKRAREVSAAKDAELRKATAEAEAAEAELKALNP